MIDWLQFSEFEVKALQLSLTVATRSVLISLPLALGCAWLLSRRFPGWFLLNILVHLPLVLPPVAVGYVLLTLFGIRGAIGQWLFAVFGVRLAFSVNGAALATAVMIFPLLVRAIRTAIEALPTGLMEAARTLGAKPLDRWLTIAMPLLLPGLIAGVATAFAAGIGEFGAVITFAGNIPGETQTLALALYSAMQLPTSDTVAPHLAGLAIALGLLGLALAEGLSRWARRWSPHA